MKDIKIKLIKKKDADKIIIKHHYSQKVTTNSQLNFGVFQNNVLLGALQYGPSIDKRRVSQSIGVNMNEYLELNRLAICDTLGKNAESRCLGITLRIIKKKYPHIRCILSFADACQCGDGAIYRASNFKLHSFKKNISQIYLSDEDFLFLKKFIKNIKLKVVAKKTLDSFNYKGKYLSSYLKSSKPLSGYQMKYIYYYDKNLESRNPFISFDKIPSDVKMYKGKKRGKLSDGHHPDDTATGWRRSPRSKL